MTRAESMFVYALALALTVGSALLLANESRGVATPPAFVPTLAKALGVTLLLQAGLFWAPSARGNQRWVAALLMVPGLLVYGAFVGQTMSRVVRGFAFKPAISAIAVGGTAIYAWMLWKLMTKPNATRR